LKQVLITLLAYNLSRVYALKYSVTAASVTLATAAFPKIYMISLLSFKSMLKTHLFLTVAERRGLLSLHLHFVVQYKFFVIIIIIIIIDIQPVDHIKVLGVTLESKLTFDRHIFGVIRRTRS